MSRVRVLVEVFEIEKAVWEMVCNVDLKRFLKNLETAGKLDCVVQQGVKRDSNQINHGQALQQSVCSS